MSTKLNFEFMPVPISTVKDIGLTNGCVLGLLIKLNNSLGYSYPSNRYICRELKLSEPTVKRSLKILEELKYIKRDTHRQNGKYERKIYLLGKHEKDIQFVPEIKYTQSEHENKEQHSTHNIAILNAKITEAFLGCPDKMIKDYKLFLLGLKSNDYVSELDKELTKAINIKDVLSKLDDYKSSKRASRIKVS